MRVQRLRRGAVQAKEDAALVRTQHTDDHSEQGGLSRSVRSHQGHELPRLDLHGKVVNRHDPVEALLDPVKGDEWYRQDIAPG